MSSGQSRPLLSLTPVRGRPSGTGCDESRSAKRKDTRIYIGRVYDRWCAAREEAGFARDVDFAEELLLAFKKYKTTDTLPTYVFFFFFHVWELADRVQ